MSGSRDPMKCWRFKGSGRREDSSIGQPFSDTGVGVMNHLVGQQHETGAMCESIDGRAMQ